MDGTVARLMVTAKLLVPFMISLIGF